MSDKNDVSASVKSSELFCSANRKHEARPYGAQQARKLRNGRKSDEGILSDIALRCLLSTVKFREEVKVKKIKNIDRRMVRLSYDGIRDGQLVCVTASGIKFIGRVYRALTPVDGKLKLEKFIAMDHVGTLGPLNDKKYRIDSV